MKMTFEILKNGKPLVECCSKRPFSFETREAAEAFATSCILMERLDRPWRRPGHRRPGAKLVVVERAA